MKRILVFLLSLLAVSAFAETDYLAKQWFQDLIKGENNDNQIQVLRVKGGTAANTIANGLTVSGTLTATTLAGSYSAASLLAGSAISAVNLNSGTNINAANLRAGTSLSAVNLNSGTNMSGSNVIWTTQNTLSITNGQAVQLVPGTVNAWNGVGSANGLTNTITLLPYAEGTRVIGTMAYIITPALSSNVIEITSADPMYSPLISLGGGAFATIFFANTNVFYGK